MRRALAALALVLVAGCGGGSSNGTPGPTASAVTSSLKDALVTSAVKAALIAEDPDSTTTVGVSASSGVVTLGGSVKSASIRSRFVMRARAVTGVTRVVDDLTINARGPRLQQQIGDIALAARIEAAIAAEVGFKQINVTVHDGVATLEGTVPDAKTRDTAVATARGTAGIRNVVDRLRVGGS